MDFVYYNPNPRNLHTGDCVVRALTAFLNTSWRPAFLDIINWCADRGRVNFNYRSSYNEYLKEKGYQSVYTQTWSGNTPMLRVAEKLGFKEIARKKEHREVDGKTYDALTFQLEL